MAWLGWLRSLLLPLALLASACNSDGVPVGAQDAADLGPAPSDLIDRLPWDSDLSLTVRGLDGDEGKTAWLRVHYTVTDVRTPWQPATIQGGRVTVLLRGGFDSNTFGEFVEIFVDRSGDGTCNELSEPAWELFINNSFPMDKVVKADIDLLGNPGPGSFRTRRCSEL